jgi:hypothetical protein
VVEGLVSLRGIALAAILGVESFGVWLLFRIFLRYAGFAGCESRSETGPRKRSSDLTVAG